MSLDRLFLFTRRSTCPSGFSCGVRKNILPIPDRIPSQENKDETQQKKQIGPETWLTPPVPIQLAINLLGTALAILTRRLPPRPYLACALIRTFLRVLTPRQLQLFSPPTLDTYRAFIRDARRRARLDSHAAGRAGDQAGAEAARRRMEQLREDVEPLPDGASHLLWVGDRTTATRFVYFFHGGGYMAPALRGHLEWCLQAYVLAPSRSRGEGEGEAEKDDDEPAKVAVAVLQYTLTPSARFPTQLAQAAAGLAHLLRSDNNNRVRPGQLVVGGDSAGGNLTLQLLSHLLHPLPDRAAGVEERVERVSLPEPLAGAFLVSPLVSRDFTGRSCRDNAACDMLSAAILADPPREMLHEPKAGLGGWLFPGAGLVETAAFRGGRAWAMQEGVDDKWLDGMGRVVRRVYVTCGKHEMLRDQGIALAESIRKRNGDVDVRLEVAEKEAHDFILLEGESRQVGDATVRMRDWYRETGL